MRTPLKLRRLPLIAAALFAAAAMATAQFREFTPGDKLHYTLALIESFYVDTVNSQKLVEEGIVAMLKELDPHSAYTNPEETKEMTQPLQGNFSGIGIQFNMLNDTLFVIQTTSGGPSEKVGLLPGDRIISANDTVIAGRKLKNSDIIKTLRGPKGTAVNLKVLRRSAPDTLNFRIIRDDIPIYSVDAYYMAEPGVGYIRLSRFAETTPQEFEKALADLRKQGMRDLIIDLQDNGGGIMGASTALAEHFLNKDDLIVFTKGRSHDPVYYKAERKGDFTDGKVVVLVNQYSASASEILSGALQDNDRAAIVGRRTFGKGLVQRPVPFPDGSMIKLTYSRYYTPSGRSIQKPYKLGHGDEYKDDIMQRYEGGEFMHADSVHLDTTDIHHTLRLGRKVYGGGGVMPDVFVPLDTTMFTNYYRDLLAKGTLYQYCISYVDANRKQLLADYPDAEAFIARFEATPEVMRGLVDRGANDGVEYNDSLYNVSKPMLTTLVKGLIGRDLYDMPTYYRIVNPLNNIYNEGLRVIRSKPEYNAILSKQK